MVHEINYVLTMNTYPLRKNFTALLQNNKSIVRGKLAFKTKETHWLNTEQPVIALVSIDSGFHKSLDGDLKMNAFMSTIKSCVKGRITVLLSDRAHLKAHSLRVQSDNAKAFEDCLSKANGLRERYRPYFESCSVVYWHSYVCQDIHFLPALKLVQDLFHEDAIFREHLLQDAEASYTAERMQACEDKALFLDKTIEDILEQCACVIVLSKKGYRFQFYPGSPCASTAYINDFHIPKERQLSWINVFLSIEKKIFNYCSGVTELAMTPSLL